MKNLYEILGIDKKATPEQIKTAYRAKSKEAHPDAGGDAEQFNALNKAYKILSDDEKRARFDNGEDVEDLSNSNNSKQDRVLSVLGNLFMSIVPSVDIRYKDLVATMKQGLNEALKELQGKIDEIQKEKERLEEVSKRFKAKNDKANIFEQMAISEIKTIDQNISKMNADKEIFQEATKFLDDFDYKVDIHPQTNNEIALEYLRRHSQAKNPFNPWGL